MFARRLASLYIRLSVNHDRRLINLLWASSLIERLLQALLNELLAVDIRHLWTYELRTMQDR